MICQKRVIGRYGIFELDEAGDLSPIHPNQSLLDSDMMDHDTSITCACCGRSPAVMGLGGYDGERGEIPACDMCVTMRSHKEFEVRIAGWCERNGRKPR